MSEIILDKKQKNLIDVFQKEGIQACINKANSPEEIKICEDAFIDYHKTGHISEDAYTNNDMSWIKRKEHPILLRKIQLNSEEIDLCQSGEKLQYVKTDPKGEIVRDKEGNALYLSDEEMKQRNLPLHDTTVTAFNKNDAIGYSSNEWGADGVWVLNEYQSKGVGLELLTEFRKQFKEGRQMGQMTPVGEKLARKYYRTMYANTYCKDGFKTIRKKIPISQIEFSEVGHGWGDIEASQEQRGSRYAELMKEGVEFPPIQVFGKRTPDDTYKVFDGHARVTAHKINKDELIEAEITVVDETGTSMKCR